MSRETLNISEMSTLFGVSHRTLRFYEDKGLLSPVRLGMSRHYTKRDCARLKLIVRGKSYGFSLDEIRHFLDLYETDGGEFAQRKYLRELAETRIVELREEQAKLTETVGKLDDLVSELSGERAPAPQTAA